MNRRRWGQGFRMIMLESMGTGKVTRKSQHILQVGQEGIWELSLLGSKRETCYESRTVHFRTVVT